MGQSWCFAAIINPCLSVLPCLTLNEMADEEAVLKKKVKISSFTYFLLDTQLFDPLNTRHSSEQAQ